MKYRQFILDNFCKTRTIVSRDNESIVLDVARLCGVEPVIHRWPSGTDVGTWLIPPRWDVREAWLKDPRGRVIASYDMHPLFVAPYSAPFSGVLDLATLKQHVRCHPTQRDAYYYEHRLAYDYRRRLNEWLITLPQTVVDGLAEGDYEVHLDLVVEPGDMVVGELVLPGRSDRSIALLTDYCHPGQVNDSFSGILAMIDVFNRLKAIEDRYYTYRFLLFPETIGSCALLQTRPQDIATTDLAIFSEFVGWGKDWRVLSREEPQLASRQLALEAANRWPKIKATSLFDGYGNDELIYDFAGIPALSVQTVNCAEYHSSNDSPDRLVQNDLDFAADVIYRMCDIMEKNCRWSFSQEVPFYMTRYGLYADSIQQHQEFAWRRSVLYGLRRGDTMLEIAARDGVDFDYAQRFVESAAQHGLMRPVPRDAGGRASGDLG